MMKRILDERLDLELITGSSNPNIGIYYQNDGLTVDIIQKWYGKEARLFIDNINTSIMSTSILEHASMIEAVEQCPKNSKVLIGGLGFALILLYLAESGKSNEIIVCEIDQRVIDFIKERTMKYFPNNNLSIIRNDIYVELNNDNKYDWIYIDTSIGSPSDIKDLVYQSLTKNGIYTPFNPTPSLSNFEHRIDNGS